MSAASPVIGWDIGGAHVKAVLLNGEGVVVQAIQWPCALWQGLHLLEQALQAVFARCLDTPMVNFEGVRHAVTMTGELVDLFEHRHQGVIAIADCVRKQFPQAEFYAADTRGVRWLKGVEDNTAAVASMNWHASAQCVAQHLQNALVVDIGSTTTDVTVCLLGQVMPAGWTDAARMAQGSLWYRGVVRTPLMALGPFITWQGRQHGLAAEHFATMADVYRVLGQLPAAHDMAATADGQDKSRLSSLRRVARMVGHDYEDRPETAWHDLALAFAMQHLDELVEVCRLSLEKTGQHSQSQENHQGTMQSAANDEASHEASLYTQRPPNLVVMGAGAFLGPSLAQRLSLELYSAQRLLSAVHPELHAMALVCFPAYAVAQLRRTWPS